MTPEAQRIAIAEACGWKVVDDGTYFRYLATPDGRRGHSCGRHMSNTEVFISSFSVHPEVLHVVPNYLTDLNAMHEAEKTLIKDIKGDNPLWHLYVSNLAYLKLGCGFAIHATAAQRAEAFLRTIGKWTE